MANIIFGKKVICNENKGREVPGFSAINLTGADIPKGKALNAYDHNGAIAIRLADKDIIGRECHGFAQKAIQTGQTGFVQTGDKLTILNGATTAVWCFLGNNGNILTSAPFPAGEDSIIQIVGLSVSGADLEIRIFQPHSINLP